MSFFDLRVDRLSPDEVINMLSKEPPDVLLMKPAPSTKDAIIKIAASLKDRIRFIYCYGPTATLWPEQFLYSGSHITGCLINEIENTVLDLARHIKEGADIGSLLGTAYFRKEDNSVYRHERELIVDLDSLPLPRHDIFSDRRYSLGYPVRIYKKMKVAHILSSRGCPEACSFCSVLRRSSYGKAFRCRSAANIIEELKKVVSLGFNTVYFMDDNFAYDRHRVVDICAGIIKEGLNRKIKWVAQCSVKSLDEETIKIMEAAGCSTVCMGIESANKKTLEVLSKSMDQKEVFDTVAKLKKAKVMIVAFFIIGSPSETIADIRKSIKFCKKINPDMLQVHYCSVYPDTKLFNANSLIKFSAPYECDPISNPSQINSRTLKRLYNHFYRSYYLDHITIFNFFKKQFIFYLINWRGKISFCFKSIAYITGIK
ncbi:MAG: radical SAM protein [Candidatus Omnitrophica bacterium]|nr:radical SAM protein [Candidatus Omnitrophota bacterium]